MGMDKALKIVTIVKPVGFDIPKVGNAIDFPLEILPCTPEAAKVVFKAYFEVVSEGIVAELESQGLFKLIEKENGPKVVEE